MPKFLIQKLVRDNAGKRSESKGVRVLEGEELLAELKKKLIEEANEVLEAQTKEELCAELGDVATVLEVLRSVSGITQEELTAEQKDKEEKRGGFEGHFYVDHIDLPADHRLTHYCRSNPDKYPEITE